MWHKHLTYCALLKFIVLLAIMEDGSAPKKAKYLRKAGERARPPLPVFKKETCIDQLVPPTTIMAFYKYTAENIYRAEMLCEAEQQVGPFVPCCEYLLSTVSARVAVYAGLDREQFHRAGDRLLQGRGVGLPGCDGP